MPFDRRIRRASVTFALLVGGALATPAAAPVPVLVRGPGLVPVPVHIQRYCMGTMFDVFAYHAERPRAERAVEAAWSEIVRLDRVLSNFRNDSDLSRLNRDAHGGSLVSVDPALFDIVRASIALSRRTDGRFDVTIGPLLAAWKEAYANERPPTPDDLAALRRCVGFEKIETEPPAGIRFRSDCLTIDLGGVGKGYAVDRALAILAAEGIEHALVNAGGSSIGAIGAPPGQTGWPVRLGARVAGRDVLLLRDRSMSTSQQKPRRFRSSPVSFGEILDPRTGAPIAEENAVTVVTENGTTAEALTKALLMVPMGQAPELLARFPGASALWISTGGELAAAHGESRLQLADSRRSH